MVDSPDLPEPNSFTCETGKLICFEQRQTRRQDVWEPWCVGVDRQAGRRWRLGSGLPWLSAGCGQLLPCKGQHTLGTQPTVLYHPGYSQSTHVTSLLSPAGRQEDGTVTKGALPHLRPAVPGSWRQRRASSLPRGPCPSPLPGLLPNTGLQTWVDASYYAVPATCFKNR